MRPSAATSWQVSARLSRAPWPFAVQRFGSSLNLNPHLHTVCPDGVWERKAEDLIFRKLGKPTREELLDIGWRTCIRLISNLRKQAQTGMTG